MSFIEDLESDNLMMLANDIRREYNEIRHHYHEAEVRYYRQAISSAYYKEADLIEMLEKCRQLKERYITIRDILQGRGIKPAYEGHWKDSNNYLFNGEILHSF